MKRPSHTSQPTAFRTIPAGVFKAKCLAVMDEVQSKSETVVITKRGKPVVRVVPAGSASDDFYNFMQGKGTIAGDIIAPVISSDDWNSK